MITVHGRTRCQFYNGKADWDAIRRVREAVSVPLVANGDVASSEGAAEILRRSGADAVMVGRAHYGAPWVAGEIAAQAAGAEALDVPRGGEALADYIAAHYEDMLALYGTESGLRQARKHLGWYLDRHAPSVAPDLRKTILTSFDPAVVMAGVREAFTRSPVALGLRSAA